MSDFSFDHDLEKLSRAAKMAASEIQMLCLALAVWGEQLAMYLDLYSHMTTGHRRINYIHKT